MSVPPDSTSQPIHNPDHPPQIEAVALPIGASTESPGVVASFLPAADGPPATAASVAPAIAGATARQSIVLASHTAVDIYSAIVPPILLVLQARCDLTSFQTASLLGIGAVSSGLTQPLTAWLSDRMDSRLFGALGLVMAAVCLSCIGLPNNYRDLVILFVLGQIGVGMFHPIGASTMGQLAEGGGDIAGSRRRGRSIAMSYFFVAGMAGGVIGSVLSPRMIGTQGASNTLIYLLIPGLVLAGVLHLAIRAVPHRHEHHRRVAFTADESRRRWTAVAVLYVSNAVRFTVNIALLYLISRHAKDLVASANPLLSVKEVADSASILNGTINAWLLVGMAIGGLSSGALIRAGKEKWPMVLVPILFAPAIAAMPYLGRDAAWIMAIYAGIGFAAMIPVTLTVGQRLLPHRTSLASGLMLGGAWMTAVLGPTSAEWLMDARQWTLQSTFLATAILLACGGAVCLLLDARLLRAAAVPA